MKQSAHKTKSTVRGFNLCGITLGRKRHMLYHVWLTHVVQHWAPYCRGASPSSLSKTVTEQIYDIPLELLSTLCYLSNEKYER